MKSRKPIVEYDPSPFEPSDVVLAVAGGFGVMTFAYFAVIVLSRGLAYVPIRRRGSTSWLRVDAGAGTLLGLGLVVMAIGCVVATVGLLITVLCKEIGTLSWAEVTKQASAGTIALGFTLCVASIGWTMLT